MKPQRLDLCYRIVWQGRWHVGSGYQSAVADRLLQRLPAGAPFVPGSQIKGVLRHQCERLAPALALEALDPHAGSEEHNQLLVKHFTPLAQSDWVLDPHAGSEEHNQLLVKHFTPLAQSDLVVDRLFGSRYEGECLFVANAVPVSSDEESPTSVQARTAIDRVTGTVMEQHLFTTELTEGSINLQGSIRARHPAGVLTQYDGGFPYEYALLVAALLSLDALGGDKSVGLGRCEIQLKEDTLHWNGRCIPLDDALQSFEEHEWGVMLKLLREESTP